MKKDFDRWNKEKKQIHEVATAPFYHEREIWWCSLGVNVGFEQDGTGEKFDRPIVVLRGFNRQTFFGVALTARKKEGKYYYYIGDVAGKEAVAILSQVRLIDTKRLVRKIGVVEDKLFVELKARLRKILLP